MALKLYNDTDIQNIADSIRAKKGTSNTMLVSEMSAEIDSIPTGITPTGTLSITENGTYDVTNYANADVNVSGGSMTETLLWENQRPNAIFGPTKTSTYSNPVELSEPYYNFDYIKVKYKGDVNATALLETIMPTHYTNESTGDQVQRMPTIAIGTVQYARTLGKNNDSRYVISCSKQVSGSTNTVDNSTCIPLAIYGLK